MQRYMRVINIVIVFCMVLSIGMFVQTIRLMGTFGRNESALAEHYAMLGVIFFFTATIFSILAILLGKKWKVSSIVATSILVIQVLIVLYSIWAINI